MLGALGAAGKRCPASDIAFQCRERFSGCEFEPVLPGLGCSCSRDACTHGEGGRDIGSSVGVRIAAKARESPGDVGAFPSSGFAQKSFMSRVGAAGFVISAHSGNSSCCFMVFFSPGAQLPHAVFLQKPELSYGYLPE